MVDKQHLLTTEQMASFVADGYLRFDDFIPDEYNKAAHEEMSSGVSTRGGGGTVLNDVWGENSAVGKVFRLPKVQGIIQSLVGENPLYDHHAVHIVRPNSEIGQIWHADAIIDLRMHFDIQFFYFSHDTPREMGGTMILPGSHYRRVCETDIARYQNFLSQHAVVCNAGTLLVVHHGMWHCAQPNLTDQTRYMFKLRLNPTVRQLKLWNTDDLNTAGIRGILSRNHRWYGNDVRLEIVNRIKLWRFLIGDESYDVGYWLSRLENMPENVQNVA